MLYTFTSRLWISLAVPVLHRASTRVTFLFRTQMFDTKYNSAPCGKILKLIKKKQIPLQGLQYLALRLGYSIRGTGVAQSV
jgi:hypothetical protein